MIDRQQHNHSLTILPELHSMMDEKYNHLCHYMGACDIILNTETCSDEHFSEVKKKLPNITLFNMTLKRLSPQQMRIRFSFAKKDQSILPGHQLILLLQQHTFIKHLFAALAVKNANETEKLLVSACAAIEDNIHYFTEKYIGFQVKKELNALNHMLLHDEINTMVRLINSNTLDTLMNKANEAQKQLDGLLALCQTKICGHNKQEKIAWHALEHIFSEESQRLLEAKQIAIVKNYALNLNDILERYQRTEADIISLLSVKKHSAAHAWLFKETVFELEQAHLLSSSTLNKLIEAIKNPNYLQEHGVALLKMLRKLKPLLNQDFLMLLIDNKLNNHSCKSRLNGNGLNAVNNDIDQLGWGYSSEYAIHYAMKSLDTTCSLLNLMTFLAEFRQKIAHNETIACANDFGSYRKKQQGDLFDDSQDSATSPDILYSLVTLVQRTFVSCKMINNTNKGIHISRFFSDNDRKNVDICLKVGSLELPRRRIKLLEKNHIETGFSALSNREYEALFEALDTTYFTPLKNKSMPQTDVLEMIGALTYYLSVSYPYKRGTAAIVQWVSNGLLQYHFGANVGHISMGDHLNIPFDVYAHLTDNVDEYKREFARVVSLTLNLKLNLGDEKKPRLQ